MSAAPRERIGRSALVGGGAPDRKRRSREDRRAPAKRPEGRP